MNVAFEAKEWMTALPLKRRAASVEASGPPGAFFLHRDSMTQKIMVGRKWRRVRNGVSPYQAVASASLRCSICFLTLTGNACSASRSS